MPTLIAPHGCYLVALSRNVEKGEQVEVDEATARSLIEQGWPVPKPAPANAARARTTKPATQAENTEE